MSHKAFDRYNKTLQGSPTRTAKRLGGKGFQSMPTPSEREY